MTRSVVTFLLKTLFFSRRFNLIRTLKILYLTPSEQDSHTLRIARIGICFGLNLNGSASVSIFLSFPSRVRHVHSPAFSDDAIKYSDAEDSLWETRQDIYQEQRTSFKVHTSDKCFPLFFKISAEEDEDSRKEVLRLILDSAHVRSSSNSTNLTGVNSRSGYRPEQPLGGHQA